MMKIDVGDNGVKAFLILISILGTITGVTALAAYAPIGLYALMGCIILYGVWLFIRMLLNDADREREYYG